MKSCIPVSVGVQVYKIRQRVRVIPFIAPGFTGNQQYPVVGSKVLTQTNFVVFVAFFLRDPGYYTNCPEIYRNLLFDKDKLVLFDY